MLRFLIGRKRPLRFARGATTYREWSDQAVREKIAQILKSKDEKAHHGGLYGKLMLVIHTDEFELTSSRLFPILADSVFPACGISTRRISSVHTSRRSTTPRIHIRT
jgi:hypothetical protein